MPLISTAATTVANFHYIIFINKNSTVAVHSSDGKTIHTENSLPPFTGDAKPLDRPITCEEVALAASKLKTNTYSGPDNLQTELIKYADPVIYDIYTQDINVSFIAQKYIPSIGVGFLALLQKPGKPKGQCTSLRPLTLLNGSRKMLRCSDIVWAQRLMVSVVMRKRWTFSKMGIDMSRAFDTVKRTIIIDLLYDAGCCSDDVRLVQCLLSNTRLRIKVNKSLSEELQELGLSKSEEDYIVKKLINVFIRCTYFLFCKKDSDWPEAELFSW